MANPANQPPNSRDLSTTPNIPFFLEKGDHCAAKIPEDLHFKTEQEKIELEIAGTPATIKFKDAGYIDRSTAENGYQWARQISGKPGVLVIEVGGTEIAVNISPTSNLQEQFISLSENDLDGLRKAKRFLEPEDTSSIDKLIAKARENEESKKREHEDKLAQRDQENSEPIYLYLKRGEISTGGDGLIIKARTNQPDATIGTLTPAQTSEGTSDHQVFSEIDKERGLGIPLDPTSTAEISRNHMVICIHSGYITFYDGDGNTSTSTNGSKVTYIKGQDPFTATTRS
jgi:hypothetical protein